MSSKSEYRRKLLEKYGKSSNTKKDNEEETAKVSESSSSPSTSKKTSTSGNKKSAYRQNLLAKYGVKVDNTEDTETVLRNLYGHVDSYFSKSNSIISDYTARYKDGSSSYRSDAKDWHKSISGQMGKLAEESAYIDNMLKEYGGYVDGKWASDVKAALKSNQEALMQINSSAYYDDKYWSQWENEDAYKKDSRAASYAEKYIGKTYEEIQQEREKLKRQTEGGYKSDNTLSIDDARREKVAIKNGKTVGEEELSLLQEEMDWLDTYSKDRTVIDTMSSDEIRKRIKNDNSIAAQDIKKVENAQAAISARKEGLPPITEYENDLAYVIRKYGLDTSRDMSQPLYDVYLQLIDHVNGTVDSIAYYDDDGFAMSWNTLLRIKGTGERLEEVQKTPELKMAYDDLVAYEDDIKRIENAQFALQAKAEGIAPDAVYKEDLEYVTERFGLDTTSDMQGQLYGIYTQLMDGSYGGQLDQKAILEEAGYNWDEFTEYHKWFADKEEARKRKEDYADFADDHPYLSTVFSIAAAPGQIFDYAGDLLAMRDDAEADDDSMLGAANVFDNKTTQFVNTTTSTVADKIKKNVDKATGSKVLSWLASTAYSGGTSVLQSALTTTAAVALFGKQGGLLVGRGILASQSAASSFVSAVESGSTNGQALAMSIASGAAEWIGESIFPESENLLSLAKKYDVSSLKAFIKSAAKDSGNLLIQGLQESGEEVFTEFATTISDAIINGDHSEYNLSVDKYIKEGLTREEAEKKATQDFILNVVGAAVGGFVGGAAGGSLATTTNTIKGGIGAVQYNKAAKNHGATIIKQKGTDNLMNLAKEMAKEQYSKSEAKMLDKAISKVEGKATAKNVGKLSFKMGEAVSERNMDDISASLHRQGIEEKDVGTLAGLINKVYNGNSLTKADVKALNEIKGSKQKVSAVLAEIANDPQSRVNVRTANLIAARLGVKDGVKNILTEAATAKATETQEAIKSGDIAVSEDGKAKIASTGETVEIAAESPIAKIEEVDGETVVYLNTDKGEVAATDIVYSNESDALVYESFSDLSAENASKVVNAFANIKDSKINAETFVRGMREGIFFYGRHNFQDVGSDILNTSTLAKLPSDMRTLALSIGREVAQNEVKAAAAEVRGTRLDKNDGKTVKKGRVYFENGAKPSGKSQKRAVRFANHMASAIGINIAFYDATIEGTKNADANGWYDPKTDTIHLDLQNAISDNHTIAFTLSHETVHFIKKWNPEKYKVLADFLMEQYAKHGVSTETMLQNKMAALETTDADLAFDEMIADALQTMLLDSNAAVKLAQLRQQDAGLFNKLKAHILELINKIKTEYKKLGYPPSSEEGQRLLEMQDVLEDIHKLFEDALVGAAQTYQGAENANKTIFGEATVEIGKTESGVQNQLKEHKAIGEAATAYNERHKAVHKAVLQVGIQSMYEMAEAMLPYLEEEGILPPDIPGKTIFKNGSYGRTGENTTLCVRTLTYEDFKDRVAERVGRPLTVSESLLVSQKIYDIATEPQCIYCYVAADRKAYDDYLGEYWKAMDKYIKAMRKGGDSQALYTEYLAGRKDTNQQRKRWSQWESIAKGGKEYISAKDLTTKRKRDSIIAKKNAFSEQIKDAQRYAQSASWAKTVYDYRAYKGDILKMSSKFVDMLNSEYGLRMYSFSDYTPAFIVENMQMIIDASVKGLKSLAYTKDTDYAEIFASTGQAINVSCFAKWDAESGTYVEDNRQGANWEKTKSLRKQYRNVGAVMVATNDAMVEWALKQDWVDVVIPYHIVKTGTTIANEYQWNNYTSESSDKAGNKAANIYPTEHNNDFATYSNLLSERGITPRFSRWYDMVASGKLTEDQYMKLVNEVRLPASELAPVVPSFNLDAAKKSFGIDNEGKVIKGGFVDKGGYMGGWYRQGVDVNQEVMAVSEDIEAGKSSLDVDYGMSKAGKEKVEQRYKTSEGKILKQAKPSTKDPSLLDPRTVTKDDVVEMLNNVNLGEYDDNTYIPLRISTPSALIYWAKVRRNDIIDNNPIATSAGKAYQAMAQSRLGDESRPHKLSVNDMISILEAMNDPQYIVYQGANGRYVEVINYNTEEGKKAFAVLEIGEYKDAPYMNGYEGDIYNVLVTTFSPDAGELRKLLKNPNNEVIFDKEKDLSQGTSSSMVPSVLNDKPFYEEIIPQEEKTVKEQFQKKNTSYAPTFYSAMGKAIDGIKMDKIGASSVVNFLKGKGIRNDEIKWSGIEAFLEGKKSVTKAELQEFVAGSQLQIEEQMSEGENESYKELNRLWQEEIGGTIDEALGGEPLSEDAVADIFDDMDKKGLPIPFIDTQLHMIELARNAKSNVRWSQYTLEGGTNYRELVFTMPDSSHSNQAMRAHWGQDAEGVLAHARMQDMTTSDGKKMLFIEEIQSDWHNEGHAVGYADESKMLTVDNTEMRHENGWYKLYHKGEAVHQEISEAFLKQRFRNGITEKQIHDGLVSEYNQALSRKNGKDLVPDAPFRDSYHEYVLKRLIRMAAEEGYDSIGWTTAQIQSDRWSDEYAEGYRIEYDQDIPKFLRKYGKKWGATVSQTALNNRSDKTTYEDSNGKQYGGVREWYESVMDGYFGKDNSIWSSYIQGQVKVIQDGDTMRIQMKNTGKLLDEALYLKYEPDTVWSMDITDSMEQAVLYEGQAMFQKKAPSNRTILANALESTIDTSTEAGRQELNKLKQYQDTIAKADEQEAHLAEVNAEIKELSFGKGVRDTARLKELQEDKRMTQNRINTYDRKLLNLEATKPMKDLLQREKEMVRKRTEQKGKEALAAYKEKSAATVKTLLERNSEMRKKNIERRKASEVRTKIKNFKAKMERSLLNPTDRVYVPINLTNAMIGVCDLIDTDTELYKADGSINKAQERRNDTKDRLQALKDEYEALKNNADPTYSGEYDEVIYKYLTKLRNDYQGKSLADMSYGELSEMYDILKSIDETLREARKLIGRDDAKDIYEAADDIITEQANITKKRKNGRRNAGQKAKDSVINLSLSPVRNVERMSGYNTNSELVRLFNEFEKGIRQKNMFKMQAYKAFEGLTTGKNSKTYDDAIYNAYDGRTYKDVNGRTFGVSKMQMMQTILSHEREVANKMHHIEGSGFAFADLDMLRKGRLSDAVSEEYSHRIPAAIGLVEEFKQALAEDKWAQAYMQAARNFFNGTAKDAINETYLALKHRILARDKSYIPFEVDKNFVVREISAQNDIQQTINSYGMLQETKQGASQPLIITGLNNILDRHIDQVGNVTGLAIPVRNFNKVWNVRSVDSGNGDPTVQAAIQRNWGLGGTKHITQAVQDIQGARSSSMSDWYRKVKSGYIGATFALNLSVVSKQIGSLFASTSMLKYRGNARMLGNLVYTMLNHKKIAAEVDKYTATAWMRRQGMSDAELQTLMTEARKPGLFKFLNKAPTAINPTKWITAMDYSVALSLWKYAKKDTAKKTGLKGEALLKATAEFYDSVIENTQSMTDVLHRPEIQKSGNLTSELFGTFKTDLYQMAGQLEVTFGRYMANKTGENGKVLARTVYAVLRSAVWAQLMTSLFALLRYKVDPYRDDEDEDLTAESWLKRQGFGFGGDIVGYLFPLLGSETVGLFENIMYGESDDAVDSLALTAINDLVNVMTATATSIKDREMPSAEQAKKLVVKTLQVFGIPANNVTRLVNAVQLHAKDIANGEFLSFEAGVDRTAANHIHRILEAVDAGDETEADKLFDIAMEEEGDSKLKTALGTKYKDGEVDEETVKSMLSDYFDLDDDDIHWLLDKWDYGAENGTQDGYDKYDDFKEAVKSGNVASAIKEYTDNGVEMDSLKEQIGKMYKDGDIGESKVESILTTNFGKTEDEVYWQLDKWDYAKAEGTTEGYTKYDDFFDAVETGTKLKAAIKELTDNGVEKKTLASQITSHYKPLYKEMTKSERAKLKGYLLNAYVQLGYDRSKKSKDIDKWLED